MGGWEEVTATVQAAGADLVLGYRHLNYLQSLLRCQRVIFQIGGRCGNLGIKEGEHIVLAGCQVTSKVRVWWSVVR